MAAAISCWLLVRCRVRSCVHASIHPSLLSPTLPLTLTRTLLLSYPYQQHKPRKPTRCGWFPLPLCLPSMISLTRRLRSTHAPPLFISNTAAAQQPRPPSASVRPSAKSAINVSVERRIEVKFSVEKQNADERNLFVPGGTHE